MELHNIDAETRLRAVVMVRFYFAVIDRYIWNKTSADPIQIQI